MTQNNAVSGEKTGKTVIGITGGIGAGKSRVLDYISEKYPVTLIRADEVGKELMQPEGPVHQALLLNYGEEILREDRTVDTARLASIAFRDEESQKRINAIEHPIIFEEILKRIREAGEKVVLVEAALLSEGGLTDICDEVWVVLAGRNERIRRLMENRGYSREKCLSILKRQKTAGEFREMADVILRNDGDFSTVTKKIDREMNRIIER